ncbi:MAG: hypothetical protein COV62_02575 [Candidatus Nealsonbacteria bacterium CG11_big_fil_rev_8_21_14_0_20_35_11]|uniref:Uncharacterized protein n=1 Tax=Candidatus Nealsonbacteria bacterium CG11_big_fil_rev_8_21_14_0_20_35_11 TaxID=1974713 RepID=A0A2H0MZC7_9BACT|nr:MAG: hypothetical protein COV62_02575 [Candidatus Nealsonbacteria bacterium CG11_big_fil_rev_8_21_14_0_20_35_11]
MSTKMAPRFTDYWSGYFTRKTAAITWRCQSERKNKITNTFLLKKGGMVMSFFCSHNCHENWGMIQHDCWVGKKEDFFAGLIMVVVAVAVIVGVGLYLS